MELAVIQKQFSAKERDILVAKTYSDLSYIFSAGSTRSITQIYGRCTSLLRAPVSEMTYTVSSGTLKSNTPYHTQIYAPGRKNPTVVKTNVTGLPRGRKRNVEKKTYFTVAVHPVAKTNNQSATSFQSHSRRQCKTSSVREAATICPRPLQVDLLTSKLVSESRVTWATSVPILVFLGLSVIDLGPMYATDVHPLPWGIITHRL